MCQKLLSDVKLYEALLRFDRDLAETVRLEGCLECRNRLHRANYRRKPRGHPEEVGPDFDVRLSFCCGQDGCRKRRTPPSVRFLGRRVYLGVLVVLVSALSQGLSPTRERRLREELGVSRRTLSRWRTWWEELFPASRFWQIAKARFSPSVDPAELPQSLLDRFGGGTRNGLLALLAFLSPITVASGSMGAL